MPCFPLPLRVPRQHPLRRSIHSRRIAWRIAVSWWLAVALVVWSSLVFWLLPAWAHVIEGKWMEWRNIRQLFAFGGVSMRSGHYLRNRFLCGGHQLRGGWSLCSASIRLFGGLGRHSAGSCGYRCRFFGWIFSRRLGWIPLRRFFRASRRCRCGTLHRCWPCAAAHTTGRRLPCRSVRFLHRIGQIVKTVLQRFDNFAHQQSHFVV